jgi:hypothetical protein
MAWTPLPAEAKRFEEVYIDETSQTGHRYLVLGGIVLPYHHADRFEQDILDARQPRLSAEVAGRETLREIGWKTVGTGDFEHYKRVVDTYFAFAMRHRLPATDNVRFLCSVVDTHVKGRAYSGTRGKIGFDREIYFHCMSVARNHKGKLFHVYPDDRETDEPVERLRAILNYGLRKERKHHEWAFRRLKPRLSHELQALQVSDLLIGAVAFKLNGHYDAPSANEDRRKLCEHILSRGGAWRQLNQSPWRDKGYGQFQIWFRRHKPRSVRPKAPASF